MRGFEERDVSDRTRPDGRTSSPATLRLRAATRTLRLHLDDLPILFDPDTSADRFLTGLAFMFARQRFSCAESLIGSGFGGTVMGSLARSLLIDGLRWRWVSVDVGARLRTVLGDLLVERTRLISTLERADASCPILSRWLMPLPDVADLTGASMTWLDAMPMPSEHHLLADLRLRSEHDGPARFADTKTKDATLDLPDVLSRLLGTAGLRGIVDVLDHAGHGNYLGLQSTLSEGGSPGFDLRPDHEALFMHAAAVGVTATLLGSQAAVPQDWPDEVDRTAFLATAVELTREVVEAASTVHRVVADGRVKPASRPMPPDATASPTSSHDDAASRSAGRRRPDLVHGATVLSPGDLLPESDDSRLQLVIERAEGFYASTRSMSISPWAHGDPSLHEVLAYGGGHSNLETAMATYDQPGGSVMAVFAARMLLEEAARLRWRFSVADEEDLKARAKQFFDEFRVRRRRTIGALTNSGVPSKVAQSLFSEPSHVVMKSPHDAIAKGRVQIPPVSQMLREMGHGYPEPGWLEVAYSLLSQVVHSTPVGHLHSIRHTENGWAGSTVSNEMLGLALDAACLGSAALIGHSTLILSNLSEEAWRYYRRLQTDAARVHDAARLVHGLD